MREKSRPGSRRVENELPKMNPRSERLTLFMLVVFSLTGSGAQGYARSFTYKFHKPSDDGQHSTLYTMPNGALALENPDATPVINSTIECSENSRVNF